MISKGKLSNKNSIEQQIVLGEQFFRAFYSLVQTVKIHRDNNQLLRERVESFVRIVVELGAGRDHLIIQLSNGRFFLQDEKLIYQRKNVKLINSLLLYFENRGIEGIRFYTELKDVSSNQILSFARLLNHAERQENPLDWLDQQLNEEGLLWVEIVHRPKTSSQEQFIEGKEALSEDDEVKLKQKARKAYSFVLASIKEVGQKLSSHQAAGTRKCVRMVQNLVDLMVEDEPVFLTLSTIRVYDDYTYTHSVNVALLSMCLGKHIGLSRKSLERLGLCGLFHDLGKIDLPIEILNKPGKLNGSEFEEIKKHSLNSVRQIIKLQAGRDRKAKILLPPFEHHLKYDLSGYPKINWKKPVSLFGRILTITDVFDAITSPRIYRPTSLNPDRALGSMLKGAGKDFDPLLLKVFINMLGVYPVGTLLQLDTGEIGVVMENPQEFDGLYPQVVLLVEDGKGGYRKGRVINLAERDPNTDKFRRNIVKSLDSWAFGIQPAEFLL